MIVAHALCGVTQESERQHMRFIIRLVKTVSSDRPIQRQQFPLELEGQP